MAGENVGLVTASFNFKGEELFTLKLEPKGAIGTLWVDMIARGYGRGLSSGSPRESPVEVVWPTMPTNTHTSPPPLAPRLADPVSDNIAQCKKETMAWLTDYMKKNDVQVPARAPPPAAPPPPAPRTAASGPAAPAPRGGGRGRPSSPTSPSSSPPSSATPPAGGGPRRAAPPPGSHAPAPGHPAPLAAPPQGDDFNYAEEIIGETDDEDEAKERSKYDSARRQQKQRGQKRGRPDGS